MAWVSDFICYLDSFFHVFDANEALDVAVFGEDLLDLCAGVWQEQNIAHIAVFKKVDERMIVEPAVHATENERIDIADCFYGTDGCFLGGSDRVVIDLDIAESANVFEAMR